jgi:hypothetical protein
MQIIQNNPYRTVGLLVGATAREQERQVKRLKQFIEAEQDPQDDFSFSTLGELKRTIESVTEAASKLNLDGDKMNAALFWFYKGNPITDEPAFDAIKDAKVKDAISIWAKLTNDKEVERKNASAFHNLSNLLLNAALNHNEVKEELFEKGLRLKLKFLESDFIKEFKALATDETFKTTKKELQLLFLKQVQAEIEKSGGLTSNKLLDILTKQEFSAKEDFLKIFAQKPIEQLERLLNECKAHRKSKKEDVIVAGTNLNNAAKPLLNQLKGIFGSSNLKYTSLSDKISDEVLQCGIQLFNDYKDHKTYDPGDPAMNLFSHAKSLAIGNIAKQRCQENTENLQEWIDDKPERDKQKLIGDDLQFITSSLEKFQNTPDTISNAMVLINSCKPRLVNIKNALGSVDEYYLQISGAIVGNAQGMLVTVVNDAQEGTNFEYTSQTILGAYNQMLELSKFDMQPESRGKFKKNFDTLADIRNSIVRNLKSQLASAKSELAKIMEWQFLRSEEEKQRQITSQNFVINKIQKILNNA